jgi:ABC-type branched-subunit amino acid transport system ATPase component
MKVTLTLESLCAGYQDVVVRDVNMVAEGGEVLAIVGVNGAGKSTILKSIVGGARVHSGKVMLNGRDVTGVRGDLLAKAGIGYVPQSGDVFPGLSVMENLRMGAYLVPRKEVKRRVEAALARFPRLGEKRRALAHRLSGGERKQLAIARALISEPVVLLLDEPTSNLSPDLAQELLSNQLKLLAQDGACVVVVEQRVEAVLEQANRACLIGGGRMQKVGDAASMLATVRAEGLLGGDTGAEAPARRADGGKAD